MCGRTSAQHIISLTMLVCLCCLACRGRPGQGVCRGCSARGNALTSVVTTGVELFSAAFLMTCLPWLHLCTCNRPSTCSICTAVTQGAVCWPLQPDLLYCFVGHAQVQGLIIAVMHEKALGKRSRWGPYLAFLPDDMTHMLPCWTVSGTHITRLLCIKSMCLSCRLH